MFRSRTAGAPKAERQPWQFDYRKSDVEALFRRGNWSSWRDAAGWLEQSGEGESGWAPGVAVAMAEDLRSLDAAGVPFTSDPGQAYKLAHRYRAENNLRFLPQHQVKAGWVSAGPR